jgi:hypothetical protein
MTKTSWTKTPGGYAHSTGVTMIKLHPRTAAYALLVPSKARQDFGSFSSARAAGNREVAALLAAH